MNKFVDEKLNITLYNDDCINVLKQLEDNSIDCIITDPPYEVSVNHDGGKLYYNKGITKSNEDLVRDKIDTGYDIEAIGKELLRVCKEPNIYIWCNKQQIPQYFDFYVNKNELKFDILVWIKQNALPTYKCKYLDDKEYCLYFKGKGVLNPTTYEDAKTYWLDYINTKDKKLWEHPTIKPLYMIERLVKNSSKENDLILDPFMGSGTTGVVCKNLNRKFIGIEIEEKYYEISKKRILRNNGGLF